MVPLSLLRPGAAATQHDRPFTANRCPANGGHPSGPTVCFSPAAQGPVTETLCTRLAPPGGSLHAEENRFFPVHAFALCSKCIQFNMDSRQCQGDALRCRMKRSLAGECTVPLVGRLFVKKMRSFWKHALEPLLSGFWLCYTAFRTPETAQRLRVLYLL